MRTASWLAMVGAALAWQSGAAQPGSSGVPYRVECGDGGCRADLATYVGWRVFVARCATCHGADARGSSFAPDLTQRMRAMTERAFFAALDHGYFGPNGGMPPRGRDPNVAPYYDELWSFLRARADGALAAGPVERLTEGDGAPAD